jgi:hypothetical protein
MFMGEIPLFLEIPWLATARASKQSRSFVWEKRTLADVEHLSLGCPRDLQNGGNPGPFEGYSQQRETDFTWKHGGGPGDELNNRLRCAARLQPICSRRRLSAMFVHSADAEAE